MIEAITSTPEGDVDLLRASASLLRQMSGALERTKQCAEASEARIAAVYNLIVGARDKVRARLEPGSDDLRDVFQLLQDAKYGLGGRTNVFATLLFALEEEAARSALTPSQKTGQPDE